MTTKRGQELAAKLKAGIETRAAEEAARKSEAAAIQARLSTARQELLDDLFAFGEAVGHLTVSRTKKRVVLSFEGASLRFEIEGKSDKVTVEGGDVVAGTVLGLQSELKRWVVYTPISAGQDDQELLFDGGLERLVALGLAITTPVG